MAIENINITAEHAAYPEVFVAVVDAARESSAVFRAAPPQVMKNLAGAIRFKVQALFASAVDEGDNKEYVEAKADSVTVLPQKLAVITSFTMEASINSPELIEELFVQVGRAIGYSVDSYVLTGTLPRPGSAPRGNIDTLTVGVDTITAGSIAQLMVQTAGSDVQIVANPSGLSQVAWQTNAVGSPSFELMPVVGEKYQFLLNGIKVFVTSDKIGTTPLFYVGTFESDCYTGFIENTLSVSTSREASAGTINAFTSNSTLILGEGIVAVKFDNKSNFKKVTPVPVIEP